MTAPDDLKYVWSNSSCKVWNMKFHWFPHFNWQLKFEEIRLNGLFGFEQYQKFLTYRNDLMKASFSTYASTFHLLWWLLLVKFVRNPCCLLSNLIIEKIFGFFSFLWGKIAKMKQKYPILEKNVIQNQTWLKISFRSAVFNLLLKEWSEGEFMKFHEKN